jgi:hypothetical protein
MGIQREVSADTESKERSAKACLLNDDDLSVRGPLGKASEGYQETGSNCLLEGEGNGKGLHGVCDRGSVEGLWKSHPAQYSNAK